MKQTEDEKQYTKLEMEAQKWLDETDTIQFSQMELLTMFAVHKQASYKAELIAKIDERIRGLDIRIKSYEAKGKDQTANRSKRKQLHSIKALLEDNPTEKVVLKKGRQTDPSTIYP